MSKIRIFILDDDRFYGTLIRKALEDEAFEVRYFQSEYECLRAFSEPPDILILDHQLEDSTGIQVMELIDKSKRAKPVIVYLSAQEHVHVALKALNLGAVNYLEKSDKVLDELRAEIDRIVVATKNFLRPLDRRKYRFDALKH